MKIMKIDRKQMSRRKVKVRCPTGPRGHRIGTLTVFDDGDRLSIGLHIKGLQGGRWDDIYRYDPESGRTLRQVEIGCPHRKCGYKGRISHATLMAELAAELAGKSPLRHAEYRLTV